MKYYNKIKEKGDSIKKQFKVNDKKLSMKQVFVKTIVCDIDGILCENKGGLYILKRPNVRNLSILSNFYERHWKIILFTSRLSRYRKSTKEWLKKYNVQYHKLIMNKPKGDIYIDDKTLSELRDYSRLKGGLK